MTPVVRTHDVMLPHGVTLACRSAGNGPRRVVLLHGFPEAAFVWDEVMRLVGSSARCLAPNLRGFIGSSSPVGVEAYRVKHLVGDLAALLQTQGEPIDLLVGHDWGGALAWGLAAAHPQLMKRLLIINAPHPAAFLRELRHSPEQQAASAYMNFLCRPDAAALLEEHGFARLWKFLGQPSWLSEEVRTQYLAAWSHGLEGPLNFYRASPLRPATQPDDALHTLQLPDELVTVRVPTHVLWGEADRALLPGLLDGLPQWVPELTVQRVPGASHWIVHEQPQLVAHAIIGLLS